MGLVDTPPPEVSLKPPEAGCPTDHGCTDRTFTIERQYRKK
jgi:hypothetical protein